MKNKKGQLDYPIITFFIVVFGLLILAPIMLKIMRTTQTSFSSSLGNMSGGEQAATNFNAVMNVGTTFWDKIIISAFVISIILLFVSAFLIDAHPLFVILYLFISFMLVLFAPNIIGTLDNLYGSSEFATEVGMLSFMDSLRIHFGEFLVGIIFITGIIIYGKVRFFSGGRR
jgi:hypothetical protein